MTPVDKRPTNILRTDVLVVGGGAAVLTVRDHVAPREIQGRDLRMLLNKDGAMLG